MEKSKYKLKHGKLKMASEYSILMFLFCKADKLLLLRYEKLRSFRAITEFMYSGFAVNT